MAGSQPARVRAGETIDEFMERRRREAARREAAEVAGRDRWAASTATGQYLPAPRSGDVVELGARLLESRERSQAPQRAPAPSSEPEGGVRYGELYAPVPADFAELRRQQTEFAQLRRDIGTRNSWMAAPALAPVAAVLGLEVAAAIAARAGAGAAPSALNFVEREVWQRGTQRAARALTDEVKANLRRGARARYARAHNASAKDMQAQVHHSDPLEWAHLKPSADPNRLANLWGLPPEVHATATAAWRAFGRGLNGRIPSQAELMQAKLRIDRMVEPYIRRPGLPRPAKPRGGEGQR